MFIYSKITRFCAFAWRFRHLVNRKQKTNRVYIIFVCLPTSTEQFYKSAAKLEELRYKKTTMAKCDAVEG